MAPWTALRDALRAAPTTFRHLDAAQLVKHALGLATEARRIGKTPVLLYLYAEPTNRSPSADALAQHRSEVDRFAAAIAGAAVRFAACRWRDWLNRFTGEASGHAARVRERFQP